MENKDEIYRISKLGGKCGFGKRPAVVVVDFQKGFTLAPLGEGCDMGVALLNSNRIVKAAREKNMKIFYCKIAYQSQEGIDLGAWGHKCYLERDLLRTSSHCEMDDRLDIQPQDIVFEKQWASAFFGTHLVQMLINLRIDTVIFTGCVTGGCLNASVVDGVSYGFRTIVAGDACGDRSREIHDLYLWNMNQKYADVLTTDEVVKELQKFDKLEYDLLW